LYCIQDSRITIGHNLQPAPFYFNNILASDNNSLTTMNITMKIVLALAALAVASFPLIAEGCNGHASHHHHAHDDHHLQNADEDCSEDNVHDDGISNSVVGRRLDSVLRCDTAEPSQAQLRMVPIILARWQKRVDGNRRLVDVITNIPVYFHIIKRTDGTGGTRPWF
jgi:hypothetical protein